MKYSIRRKVFETNSSSTHAMVLLTKGEAGEQKGLDGLKDDFFEDATEIRRISSRKMKSLLLYQFYYYYVGEGVFPPGRDMQNKPKKTKGKQKDIDEARRKADELFDYLFSSYEGEERAYVDGMRKKIGEDYPGYMSVCNECFLNDVLDDCFCGVSYPSIAATLGVDITKEGAEKEVADKLLEDGRYFAIGECWMGGWYEKNFPTEF